MPVVLHVAWRSRVSVVTMGKVISVTFAPKPTAAPAVPAKVIDLAVRRSISESNEEAAYNLYVAASAIDEEPSKYDQAERMYREAILLDPTLDVAYTNLGNIYHRRGRVAAAMELYHRALLADPRQVEALYNLGYCVLNDDPKLAADYFRRAIDADPRFADAHFNLGQALHELGDYAAAVPCWKAYLELEPIGDWADQARTNLREALQKRPAKRSRLARRGDRRTSQQKLFPDGGDDGSR